MHAMFHVKHSVGAKVDYEEINTEGLEGSFSHHPFL